MRSVQTLSLPMLLKPLAGEALGFDDGGGGHILSHGVSVIARRFVAFHCRKIEPHVCSDVVLEYTVAPGVHDAEVYPGAGVPLLRE